MKLGLEWMVVSFSMTWTLIKKLQMILGQGTAGVWSGVSAGTDESSEEGC